MSGLSAPNGTDVASFEDRFLPWTCVHWCLTCVRVRKECSVGKIIDTVGSEREGHAPKPDFNDSRRLVPGSGCQIVYSSGLGL